MTNLNDSGEGSYRAAVNGASSDHFDVIVFKTGGTIVLDQGGVKSSKSCVYLAGQTAPGDGVQFTSPGLSSPSTPLSIFHNSDWVVRYLRFRQNAADGTNAQFFNIVILGAQRVVLDHVSTCCADDKEIAIDQSPERGSPVFDLITLSNSVVYATRRTGINIHGDEGAHQAGSVSVIGNYMGGNKWRWPRLTMMRNGQVVNNVIYGWDDDGVRVATDQPPHRINIEWINNYQKKFLDSKLSFDRFGTVEWSDTNLGKQGIPNFYVVGNVHTGIAPSPSDDQTQWKFKGDRSGLVPDSAFKSSSTLSPPPVFNVTPRWSALELSSKLLPDVGASRRLTCDGEWVGARDALDATFIAEFQTSTRVGTGKAEDYGGLPTLSRGTPCADGDGDGMPDEFESRWGLDPNGWDAGGDADGDGYLNIEEYLNGSRPM